MRFVSLKNEAQLDLQLLHRMRERLVCARTTLITSSAPYCWNTVSFYRRGAGSSCAISTTWGRTSCQSARGSLGCSKICVRNGRHWIANLKFMTQNSSL